MSDRDRRLLHRRSEYGYTDRLDHALPQEPEAVPADYQAHLTKQAERRAHDRQREAWRSSRDRIYAEIAHLHAQGFDPSVMSDLRVIARVLERLDRRLTR